MQDTFAKQSGRRAAKRDRIERIGRIEQAILSPLRDVWRFIKLVVKDREVRNYVLDMRGVQIAMIAVVLGLIILSGFTDTLVNGWLGE